MTYEEASNFIWQNHCCGCKFCSCNDCPYEFALNALEKQLPKKPIGRHTDYRCTVCGTRVRSGKGSSSRTKDTVCRKCFQVLDWSDTE